MTSRGVPPEIFESDHWKGVIFDGALEMGIRVSNEQMERLVRFAQILSEWNRKVNLTAITDPREMAVKHFLDSMAALPHIPETGRLLDIGSGAGFPGLVIAVFRPELSITSIDSVRKKISFQLHLIRTLGITSARALHARAESLRSEDGRYDIIVSRALGSLEMFTNLAMPLLAKEGCIIAYKGVTDDGEADAIETLKSKHTRISVCAHRYLLPRNGDRRSLIFIGQKPNDK